MKQKLTTICLLFLFITLNKTTLGQTYLWANQISAINTNTNIQIWSSVVDGNGNVLNLGTLIDTADMDPGVGIFNLIGNQAGQNVFIQKLDSNGNFVWAKQIGGTQSIIKSRCIDVDNNNNIIIAGTYNLSVDFNPSIASTFNVTASGSRDVFVLKLNSSGLFQWVKTFGANSIPLECLAMKIDNNNEVIIGGSFKGTVDFDPGAFTQYLSTNSNTATAPFLVKLATNGYYIWARSFTTSNTGVIKSIEIDASNNVISTGEYKGNIDLDPGIPVALKTSDTLSNDIFISKLNVAGNYQTCASFGGAGNEEIVAIKVDNANNYILAGNFIDQCDFDPSIAQNILTSTTNSKDCFVLKLSNSLNYNWVKQFGSNTDEYLFSMNLDPVNFIYLYGNFQSTVDFNPGIGVNNLVSSGMNDIFMLKLNSNGGFMRANKIGNTLEDEGKTIFVGSNYSIYGSGQFNNTVDFNPASIANNLTATNIDGYSFRWAQCIPSTNSINLTGCNVVVNGDTLFNDGIYTQFFINSVGCDSVLTINLSSSSTNTIVNNTVCGSSYTFNNQTYNSSGVYTQNYTNVIGCDSILTLNLTLNPLSYDTLTVSECGFYFYNNQFYFTSGMYNDTLINSIGCDSIFTLNLTINPTYNLSDTINTCGPITYNGNSYTVSGNYLNTFTTVNGCDSIVNLVLNITPPITGTYSQTSCGPISLNGITYTTSGNYSQLLTNTQGCDSTLNITLTINYILTNVTQSGNILSAIAAPPATYQWITCDPIATIPNAISQIYIAPYGLFAVIISENGCSDTSECLGVFPDAINDINIFESMKLYPNPASNILNIEFTKSIAKMNLIIKSISGQKLLESTITNQQSIQLPVSNLANGIYFVEFNDGKNKSTIKFIKE